MSNRDTILNSEKSADELAEEMMAKYEDGGYNEDGEKVDEAANNDDDDDVDPPANENDDDDVSDIDDDNGDNASSDNDSDNSDDDNDDNQDGDEATKEEKETLDLFSKINALNNPDNLDVPPGMVPYRENKQTKFATPEDFNRRFHMGSHFTKNMQKHKKQIAAAEKFEKAGITEEDMQIMKALKSGKIEDAMKGIGKQYKLDSENLSRGVVDIEDEQIAEYKFESNNQNSYEVSENVKNYFNDMPVEYYQKYEEMSSSIPSTVRKIIDGNDALITGFANDVATGKAEKIMDHVHSSISHLTDFEQHLRLTNPESFFNLYGEGEKLLFGNSSDGIEENGTQPATPIQGSQIDNKEKAVRNRLNQNQVVRSQKPLKNNKKNDVTSRIMNEEGYVDKHIKEIYGL